MLDLLIRLEARGDAPNYRQATAEKRCGNCRHLTEGGECKLFGFKPARSFVCDSWLANPQPPDTGDRTVNVALRAS